LPLVVPVPEVVPLVVVPEVVPAVVPLVVVPAVVPVLVVSIVVPVASVPEASVPEVVPVAFSSLPVSPPDAFSPLEPHAENIVTVIVANTNTPFLKMFCKLLGINFIGLFKINF